MRFPIDVAFLDRDDRVTHLVSGLRPFRVAACLGRACAVLEMASGVAHAAGLRVGDRLVSDTHPEGLGMR